MKRVSVAVAGVMLLAGCGSGQGSGGNTAQSKPSPHGGLAPSVSTAASPGSAAPGTLTVSNVAWKLPFAIAREAVIPVSAGTVIVAGGMLPDDSSSARSFELDLLTGRATSLASLPVPVHDVAGGLYGGEPSVYGGGNSSEQSTVQQFLQGAWRVVAHMPTTRSDLSVGVVNSTTYVLGGYDGKGVPTQVLAQSGSQGLTPAGQLSTGVRYAASAVFGTSVYLFGGEVNGAEMNLIQRFDTVTGRTTIIGHLPTAVGHASAAVLGDRILVMGGRVKPDVGTASTWWFDPASGRITRGTDLPAPVTDAAVAVSRDHRTAWLLGGESPSVRSGVIQLSLS